MTWLEIVLAALAGLNAGAAIYWRIVARRARRRQFSTAVKLHESRKALMRVVRDLVGASKRLDITTERADELNELAAAYVIISQLDELREDPAPHTVR